MTNNTIRFASENTAVASKVFMKNTMIYGSNEYKILKTFKAENPNVTVSAKKSWLPASSKELSWFSSRISITSYPLKGFYF